MSEKREEMIQELAELAEYGDAYRRPFSWYLKQTQAMVKDWSDNAIAMKLDNRREGGI